MCILYVIVGKWIKQFAEGRTDVHNVQHSGRLSGSMSFDNVQQLHDLLYNDFGVVFPFARYRLRQELGTQNYSRCSWLPETFEQMGAALVN